MASLSLSWRFASPWLYYYAFSGYWIGKMISCFTALEGLKLQKLILLLCLSLVSHSWLLVCIINLLLLVITS